MMRFKEMYIHATHASCPKGQQMHLGYSSHKPTFYQNCIAMRNTADVTGYHWSRLQYSLADRRLTAAYLLLLMLLVCYCY
jgi:hypothetical protein